MNPHDSILSHRPIRLRKLALPATCLVGLLIAAASCAADLADPAQYTAARNLGGGGGSPPSMTGGTTAGGQTTGGTAGMGGGAVPPLPACAKTVLYNSCSLACHNKNLVSAPTASGGLDLSGDDVGMRIKDAPATNLGVMGDKSGCGMGALLINSTNNAESVMLKRIKGTQGTCGTPMPLGNTLNATDLKCLEDWIMSF
jgi:hypothetical protein